MATIQWTTPAAEENILTTELNSLANSANKLSAVISNDGSGEHYVYADLELSVAAQGAARSAGAFVAVYLLATLDDTNFTFGDDSTDPPMNAWVGNILFDAATNARVSILRNVALPPRDFKILITNETGQNFAASGNTLTMRRYKMESV